MPNDLSDILLLRRRRRITFGPTWLPEAQALFNAMDVKPSNDRALIENTLIGGLIQDEIWPDLDLLYLTAAHDAQAARLNWKSPGDFTLIPVNSPTFEVDRGYTGDGSSSRLRPQWVPSAHAVKFTLNDASVAVLARTDNDNNTSLCGLRSMSSSISIVPHAFGQFFASLNEGDDPLGPSSASSVGFFFVQRRGETDKRYWRDGALLETKTTASTDLSDLEIWLCGREGDPSYLRSFDTRQIAIAAIGASLAGKEAAFNNHIHTRMQAIGAA